MSLARRKAEAEYQESKLHEYDEPLPVCCESCDDCREVGDVHYNCDHDYEDCGVSEPLTPVVDVANERAHWCPREEMDDA